MNQVVISSSVCRWFTWDSGFCDDVRLCCLHCVKNILLFLIILFWHSCNFVWCAAAACLGQDTLCERILITSWLSWSNKSSRGKFKRDQQTALIRCMRPIKKQKNKTHIVQLKRYKKKGTRSFLRSKVKECMCSVTEFVHLYDINNRFT